MKQTLTLLAVTALSAVLLSSGLLNAQEMRKEVRVEKRVMEPCGRSEPCEACQPGGSGGMMPELPPEVQRKLLEHRTKTFKDIAAARNEVAQKKLELELLWLEDNLNMDKIIAKMKEVRQAETALAEKRLRNWSAAYNLVPEELRKTFRGCCPGMGRRGMMRRPMGIGPGRMGIMRLERATSDLGIGPEMLEDEDE